MICVYNALEHHKDKNHKCTSDNIVKLNACFLDEYGNIKNNPNKDYLGIHEEYCNDEKKVVLKSYYYIGYRWLEKEKSYIHVSSKEHKGYKADYLTMLLECLDDSIVSKKLNDIYKIFFDEPWIDIDSKEDSITPLIVLHFLKGVKKISQKGLKKGYIKVTENMTSKVKGKILVNQTIKHNHFKNRLDKTVCNHQVFTINCIENQILKTALMQCSRHLSGFINDDIQRMLRENLNSFELVDVKEVYDSDFSKIKHSPFYKEYKEALRLAKMIFKRLGFTLKGHTEAKTYKVPPFYINMPELFERYVEVQLRKKYDDLIDGNERSYTWGMRPDFLLPAEKMIIDAKYKYWIDKVIDDRRKDDYLQLSLYGREKDILKDAGVNEGDIANILFIYPSLKKKQDVSIDSKNVDNIKFQNIYKLDIYIPKLLKENE